MAVSSTEYPGEDVAPPEDIDTLTNAESALEEATPVGQGLTASMDTNLREGPSATGRVVAVAPEGATVTVVSPTPSEGWYQVQFGGKTGWASGLSLVGPSTADAPSEATDAEAASPDESWGDLLSPQAAGGQAAVDRSIQWVNVKMPYCGGVNGGSDSICGGTCRRTGAANKAIWNKYRSDCSGLVSWSWGLAAPGLTTGGFAPHGGNKSFAITVKSLMPGDALNTVPRGHIVLFAGWKERYKVARIVEESNCGKVATGRPISVTVKGKYLYSSYHKRSFLPIRKR